MSENIEDQNSPEVVAQRLGIPLETYQSWSPYTRGVCEKGFWGQWLSTMSPEHLAIFRQKEKTRMKIYNEIHEEENRRRDKEYRERNKERLSEKHSCDICGGSYTIKKKLAHFRTKKHQEAMQ